MRRMRMMSSNEIPREAPSEPDSAVAGIDRKGILQPIYNPCLEMTP